MKLTAWHSNHEYFSKANCSLTVPGIRLGRTHTKLPVVCTDAEQIGDAFSFFNWVHCDFEAPQEVNEHSAKFRTHASMSVGDVVEVNDGESYHWCAPMGWVDVTNHVKGALVVSGGNALMCI